WRAEPSSASGEGAKRYWSAGTPATSMLTLMGSSSQVAGVGAAGVDDNRQLAGLGAGWARMVAAWLLVLLLDLLLLLLLYLLPLRRRSRSRSRSWLRLRLGRRGPPVFGCCSGS